VEELLIRHACVRDATVIGIDDESKVLREQTFINRLCLRHTTH